MYAPVWNRVVLLAAGIAFGWNLVHYWVAPAEEAGRYRLRLIVAALAGLGLSAWLASQSIAAGLSGAFVVVATALVAYAANTRQVNRPTEVVATLAPSRPETLRDETIVLLVASGEPARYTGPEPWARWLMAPEARAAPSSWFLRPLVYRRIRAAYERMGDGPLAAAVAALAAEIRERLGSGYVVEPWVLTASESLRRQLVRWAEEGYRSLILVSLPLAPHDARALHEAVSRSRIREVGVTVEAVDADVGGWPAPELAQRVRRLMSGEPLSAPAPLAPAQVDALTEWIRAAA